MDSRPPVRRTLLGAAVAGWLAWAVAWPVRALGPAPRSLRIGVLSINTPGRGDRLRAALAEYGYVEGRNLEFEVRSGDGDNRRLPGLAAELVRRKVDFILTFTTPGTRAACQATSTIPIIMWGVGGDPVASGLVASLARPGGNITGRPNEAGQCVLAKRLELLERAAPGIRRVT